jgi:hypothetical protein
LTAGPAAATPALKGAGGARENTPRRAIAVDTSGFRFVLNQRFQRNKQNTPLEKRPYRPYN